MAWLIVPMIAGQDECLVPSKPLKSSPSDAACCRFSSMMTLGSSSTAFESHLSAMCARYCLSSLLDLWSTLNVAIAVASLISASASASTRACASFPAR